MTSLKEKKKRRRDDCKKEEGNSIKENAISLEK